MSLTNLAEGYLDTGHGHQAYWSSHGNKSGPVILLIHGGGNHTFDLEKITAFPEEKFHIVTWHQRAMGQSRYNDALDHNTIFANVHDMEALRKHLNIDKWHLFSWSFGGIFMSAYGVLYPERCQSLTGYAPFLGEDEDWDIMFERLPAYQNGYLRTFNAATMREALAIEAQQILAADTREAHIDRLFRKASGCDGFDCTKHEFTATRNDEEWDVFLGWRNAADLLEGAVMAASPLAAKREGNEDGDILPVRWLWNLSNGNDAFQSIPTTLLFGSEDDYVAPNANISFVYPYSTQIMIHGAGHDVHDPLVQKEIEKHLPPAYLHEVQEIPLIRAPSGNF